ncbi:MAG TPA: hypothetical protein VFX24_11835 [Ktedonobacterales bacterium]|jgi:hypothetical protein|nr:hypothetical protein [Ktedonobacterales bacterium]
MNQIVLNFFLANVLPSILFILLIALVAVLGVARWPRALLALALVALALRILGIVIIQIVLHGVILSPASEFLLAISNPTINMSVSITTIGTFLALVMAARGRSWGWLAAIVLTAIISSGAVGFAFSYYGLFVFVGMPRATQMYAQPSYIIITTILASLNILAILLYTLLGQREPAVAPDAG